MPWQAASHWVRSEDVFLWKISVRCLSLSWISILMCLRRNHPQSNAIYGRHQETRGRFATGDMSTYFQMTIFCRKSKRRSMDLILRQQIFLSLGHGFNYFVVDRRMQQSSLLIMAGATLMRSPLTGGTQKPPLRAFRRTRPGLRVSAWLPICQRAIAAEPSTLERLTSVCLARGRLGRASRPLCADFREPELG